ncbi:Uncharacterized protein TPAR_07592 [Tolypocladium paradoxum]|uniref:Uncharacterized protein n=1 Tax=Tolypocladium paradoxum TaxID=94208 RepID=A0A2S4KPU4_9HYPO|nr:Uncharacterized protein TPAR_07592 [Tolypocladium paradoxum]
MEAVTELMAGLSSIAERIEAIPAMFRQPDFRPSSQEAAGVKELASKILRQAETLQRKVTECEAGWTPEVYRKADGHMSRAGPMIRLVANGQIKWPILRRNLVAIFQGPQVSSVDSANLKSRKNNRGQRAEALRSQEPAVILAWGASLAPSTWEEMDRLVFNDLVKRVAKQAQEVVSDLPPTILEIVRSLGEEEPLTRIEEYQDFVRGIEKLDSSAPRHHRRKRRRLNEDGIAEGHLQSVSGPHSGNTRWDWSVAGMMPMVPGAKAQEPQEDWCRICLRFGPRGRARCYLRLPCPCLLTGMQRRYTLACHERPPSLTRRKWD